MAVFVDFDRRRELKFDLAAIKDLERASDGAPLGKIVTDLGQMGITSLTLALWAGLKHEDRTLTPNLVTKILEKYLADRKSLTKLLRAVNDAIDESGLFRGAEAEEDEAVAGNAQTDVQPSPSGGRSENG
jgi:hypothetical protein